MLDEPSGNGICDKDVFGFGPAFNIGKPGATVKKKKVNNYFNLFYFNIRKHNVKVTHVQY